MVSPPEVEPSDFKLYSVAPIFSKVVTPRTWARDSLAVLIGTVLGLTGLPMLLILTVTLVEPVTTLGKIAIALLCWLAPVFIIVVSWGMQEQRKT